MASKELFPQVLDIDTLKDTSDGTEKIDMRIEYSFAEIQNFKIKLAEVELELQKRQNLNSKLSTLIADGKVSEEDLVMAIKEANLADDYNFYLVGSKSLKKQADELKQKVLYGFFDEKDISCFIVIDIANKMKHYYDASNGVLRQSLPLKKQQTTIFTHLNNNSSNEHRENPFEESESAGEVYGKPTGTDAE